MSKRFKFAFFMLLVGAAAWFAPTARADEWDKLTVLTFNEPVEIPGQVLPAGTYVFKLLDSPSDRNVVQIFTEDQKHLLATVMAIPDYRLEPTGKTVVTFEERASGSPQALHSWFYPGDNSGLGFVYPKSETQLASKPAEPAPVAAAPAPQQAMTEQPPNEANDQSNETSLSSEIVREEDVIIAQAAPPPDDNAPPASFPDTLPKTAGNFASIPLIGLVLLTGGFTALRFATKQS